MTAPHPRVLLVEDEDAQRQVLAYNLTAGGFDVDQAPDGDEALLLVAEAALLLVAKPTRTLAEAAAKALSGAVSGT